MRRLRFLRILVPAVLLPFLLLLAWKIQQRPAPHSQPVPGQSFNGPRAEKIEITDLFGGARRGSIRAGVFERDGDIFRLKNVERIELPRDGAPPLVISAGSGTITGASGQRLLRLEGGVDLRDERQDFHMSLPTLEFSEAAGQTRSLGEVLLEAPGYHGRAAGIVYGMRGQRTEIFRLELDSKDGASLRADKAFLTDEGNQIELVGDVAVKEGESTLRSDRMRVERREDGRVRLVEASGDVSGSLKAFGDGAYRFSSQQAVCEWDATGHLHHMLLREDASVRDERDALSAGSIDVLWRDGEAPGWVLTARGGVQGTTVLHEEASMLTAESLDASLGADGSLIRGEVSGRVRFEGTTSIAEGARASYQPAVGKGTVRILAEPGVRARLSSGRSRVVAEKIQTDPRGSRLEAEGRVEAALLPDPKGESSRAGMGIFNPKEVIHFVAARMESLSSGGQLHFRGAVRGWQGDRNLSADEVDLEQERNTLSARGGVNTRMARAPGENTSEADYIQVAAERLDYQEDSGEAVYAGRVRLRQAEGWLEAERVEVALARGGGGAEVLRAFDKIRFEFRAPDPKGIPRPVAGEGDRAVYTPSEHTVLLFGDVTPATVRRNGEGGATTSGRVLRYRMDLGRIEVESGERDRARIRTSGS